MQNHSQKTITAAFSKNCSGAQLGAPSPTHVRPEAVLCAVRLGPEGLWAVGRVADPLDRLGRLEAVLPGNHQPQRGTVLHGNHLQVSDCYNRKPRTFTSA